MSKGFGQKKKSKDKGRRAAGNRLVNYMVAFGQKNNYMVAEYPHRTCHDNMD